MQGSLPVTIVETPEFLTFAGKLLREDERDALIDYLAYNHSGRCGDCRNRRHS